MKLIDISDISNIDDCFINCDYIVGIFDYDPKNKIEAYKKLFSRKICSDVERIIDYIKRFESNNIEDFYIDEYTDIINEIIENHKNNPKDDILEVYNEDKIKLKMMNILIKKQGTTNLKLDLKYEFDKKAYIVFESGLGDIDININKTEFVKKYNLV